MVDADIVVDNCAICRNHIMDLCEFSFVPSSSLNNNNNNKINPLIWDFVLFLIVYRLSFLIPRYRMPS